MAKLFLFSLLSVLYCLVLCTAISRHGAPVPDIGRSASSVPFLRRRSHEDHDAPRLNIHRQMATSLDRSSPDTEPVTGFTIEGKPRGESKRFRVHLEPLRDSPRVSLLRALCHGRNGLERGTRHVLVARRKRPRPEARLYVGKVIWRQPQRSHHVETRPGAQTVIVNHAGGEVNLGNSRLAPRATTGPDFDAVLGGSVLEGSASTLDASTEYDTDSSIGSGSRPGFNFRDLARASWWRDAFEFGPASESESSGESGRRAPPSPLARTSSQLGGGREGTGDQDFVGAFFDFRRNPLRGPRVAVSSERLAQRRDWELEYRGQIPDDRRLTPIMKEIVRRHDMTKQRWVREVEQALLHRGPIRH